jgi:REP element-mobilizing transposase RayT
MIKDLSTRKRIRLAHDVYQQGYAFSITVATYQRYPWFRLYPELAGAAMQLFPKMFQARQTVLFSWCIMADHLHFLLKDKDIVDFVHLFKGRLTPLARRLEHGRVLWQRSFHDHVLREEESLENVARYIWQNPTRSGIISCASDCRWNGSLVWPN